MHSLRSSSSKSSEIPFGMSKYRLFFILTGLRRSGIRTPYLEKPGLTAPSNNLFTKWVGSVICSMVQTVSFYISTQRGIVQMGEKCAFHATCCSVAPSQQIFPLSD